MLAFAALAALVLIEWIAFHPRAEPPSFKAVPAAVPTQRPNAPPEAVQPADFHRLTDQVEELRGLRFLRQVPAYVQTHAETRRYLTRILDQDVSWDSEQATLTAFGFIPADFPLRKFMLDFYTEQVAGYYDYHTGSFYMTSQALDDSMVIHEMDHAMQDQHFQLRRFDALTRKRKQDDFTLAVSALIEGEAMVVMLDAAFRETGKAALPLDELQNEDISASSPGGGPVFDGAPPYFRRLATFPYLAGSRFVDYHRRRGSWRTVDRMYANGGLPRSTEEILHPEKYGEPADAPRTVRFPARPNLPGWEVAAENTFGEARMRIFWDQFAHPVENRNAWSDGWAGDRFEVWRNADRRAFVVWRSEWDSAADAREFAYGMRKVMEKRYDIRLRGRGIARWFADSGERSWRMERKRNTVVVVDAAPPALAEVMLARGWRAKTTR